MCARVFFATDIQADIFHQVLGLFPHPRDYRTAHNRIWDLQNAEGPAALDDSHYHRLETVHMPTVKTYDRAEKNVHEAYLREQAAFRARRRTWFALPHVERSRTRYPEPYLPPGHDARLPPKPPERSASSKNLTQSPPEYLTRYSVTL